MCFTADILRTGTGVTSNGFVPLSVTASQVSEWACTVPELKPSLVTPVLVLKMSAVKPIHSWVYKQEMFHVTDKIKNVKNVIAHYLGGFGFQWRTVCMIHSVLWETFFVAVCFVICTGSYWDANFLTLTARTPISGCYVTIAPKFWIRSETYLRLFWLQ